MDGCSYSFGGKGGGNGKGEARDSVDMRGGSLGIWIDKSSTHTSQVSIVCMRMYADDWIPALWISGDMGDRDGTDE